MRNLISKTTIVLFAAALLMVGCKNEAEQTFKLEIPQYTGGDKTTFGTGNTTQWSAGDGVLINAISGTVRNQSGTAVVDIDPVSPVNNMYYSLYAGRATSPSFNGENGYSFTMPTSFTYNANQLQAPMAGQCEYIDGEHVHTIVYSNIFTLLRLDFVVIPSEVTITSENTALTGEFTVTYADGEWTLTAPEADNSNKTLTISNPDWESVMYVPLPAGTHKLTIEGTCNVSGSNVAAPFYKAMTHAVNMQKGVFYPIKCAHAFSISGSQKVYISPGNLQYYNTSTYSIDLDDNARWDGDGIGANSRLRFAQHQWDNNITSNNVTSGHVHGNGYWIDLFGWATGQNPGRSRTTSLAYSGSGSAHDFADWGNNNTRPLINAKTNESWRTWHTEGSWYTLGHQEWAYLIGRANKWKKGTVNGTYGVMLAPDDFAGTLLTSATGSDWTYYEKRGVIFLPASGYRNFSEAVINSFQYHNDWSGYWTINDASTWGDYFAWMMRFSSSENPQVVERYDVSRTLVPFVGHPNKPTGLCVRLVQNAN